MSEPDKWEVAAGDPTYVRVPGVVKPIQCGSQERARLIAQAPVLADHRRRLFEALENLVELEGRTRFTTSEIAQALLDELRPYVQLEPEVEPEPRHDPDAPSVNEQAQRSYYDKYYGS